MTIYAFNLLPYERQLAAVHDTGQFLMTGWEAEHIALNLYEMPGHHFFAEMTYDTAASQIIDLQSFRTGPAAGRLRDLRAAARLAGRRAGRPTAEQWVLVDAIIRHRPF